MFEALELSQHSIAGGAGVGFNVPITREVAKPPARAVRLRPRLPTGHMRLRNIGVIDGHVVLVPVVAVGISSVQAPVVFTDVIIVRVVVDRHHDVKVSDIKRGGFRGNVVLAGGPRLAPTA